MKKEYLNFNGVNFEFVKKDTKLYNYIKYDLEVNYLDIFDAYDRPSEIKQSIFNQWWNIFDELNSINFGINSRNNSTFTLVSAFWYNGNFYKCYITKTHNYIIKC